MVMRRRNDVPRLIPLSALKGGIYVEYMRVICGICVAYGAGRYGERWDAGRQVTGSELLTPLLIIKHLKIMVAN
jgi:hypothetical protein